METIAVPVSGLIILATLFGIFMGILGTIAWRAGSL